MLDAYFKTVKLDRCKAFLFTCRSKEAESKGRLTDARRMVIVKLPSTEWRIEYE